jgi:hypothetical protein
MVVWEKTEASTGWSFSRSGSCHADSERVSGAAEGACIVPTTPAMGALSLPFCECYRLHHDACIRLISMM